jgi:hypothetical protein
MTGTELFASLVDSLMTECAMSPQDAQAATFFIAASLAVHCGEEDLASYGYKRSRESLEEGERCQGLPSDMEIDLMDGRTLTANEVYLKHTNRANNYWH